MPASQIGRLDHSQFLAALRLRIPKKAKIWCNGVFLLGGVIVIVAWAGVFYKPNYVNSLGDDVIDLYVARYTAQQKDALRALDQGATEIAFNLLDDWQQVLKGDRLYPLKRVVYTRLSNQLYAAGHGNELKAVTERWMAGDDRDITARAYYWQAQIMNPATKEAGVEGLAREFAKFPKSPTLRWFQEAALLSTYPPEERDEFWAVQQARTEPAWQVFWDTGAGFSADQSTPPIAPKREQNGEWSVTVEIPAGSLNLRLDLPAYSRLRLSKLTASTNHNRAVLDLRKIGKHMMTLQDSRGPRDDWLQTSSGNDPYISFSLEELLTDETGLVSLKIRFLLARALVNSSSEAGE